MRQEHKKSNFSSKIKSIYKRSIRKENNAQLLLLGGIIISVILIASASIAISLSNVSIPLDKTSSIKSDYDNIRKEFGIALKDNVKEYFMVFNASASSSLTKIFFEDIKNTFTFFIETFNDNYFDAEILEELVGSGPDTTIWRGSVVGVMTVKMTLSDSDEIIQEEVVYDLR